MCLISGIHLFVISLLHESTILCHAAGPRSASLDYVLEDNVKVGFIGRNPSIQDSTEALPSPAN
jgi:hypothetical protein